jgi:hypothetical protein
MGVVAMKKQKCSVPCESGDDEDEDTGRTTKQGNIVYKLLRRRSYCKNCEQKTSDTFVHGDQVGNGNS